MGILISVITITLLVLCYVRMYNRLKRLFVKVQEGSAGIDVALEKRYDMLMCEERRKVSGRTLPALINLIRSAMRETAISSLSLKHR